MRVSIAFVLLCVSSFARAEEAAAAKLVVVKQLTNDVIAQGMDLTIQYTLFNIGEKYV